MITLVFLPKLFRDSFPRISCGLFHPASHFFYQDNPTTKFFKIPSYDSMVPFLIILLVLFLPESYAAVAVHTVAVAVHAVAVAATD